MDINEGMNDKFFPLKGNDTPRVPINVKPLPSLPVHRSLQTVIAKDPIAGPSAVRLLTPPTGLVHYDTDLGSKLQTQPPGQDHRERDLHGLSRDEERHRNEWEYA